MFSARFRAPPCPRKGLRPPEMTVPQTDSGFNELFSARASGHRALRKGAQMRQNLPTRRMRPHPDLEQLKRQAKALLRVFAAGEPVATAEVDAHYNRADTSTFALHDAQLVIARRHGFGS